MLGKRDFHVDRRRFANSMNLKAGDEARIVFAGDLLECQSGGRAPSTCAGRRTHHSPGNLLPTATTHNICSNCKQDARGDSFEQGNGPLQNESTKSSGPSHQRRQCPRFQRPDDLGLTDAVSNSRRTGQAGLRPFASCANEEAFCVFSLRGHAVLLSIPLIHPLPASAPQQR